MSEKEILLNDLVIAEHQYMQARQATDWDVAQARAMEAMNICRRLHLLELREKEGKL